VLRVEVPPEWLRYLLIAAPVSPASNFDSRRRKHRLHGRCCLAAMGWAPIHIFWWQPSMRICAPIPGARTRWSFWWWSGLRSTTH